MTRRLLGWTIAEGVIAFVVGIVATYLVSTRGELLLQGWLDFAFLAFLVAGVPLAIWRPADAAIGYGGTAWVLVLLTLESLTSSTANPLLTTLCGVVLLVAAARGWRTSAAAR